MGDGGNLTSDQGTIYPGKSDGSPLGGGKFILDPFDGRMRLPANAKSGQCGPCGDDGGDVAWRELETALDVLRYATGFVTIQRTVAGALLIANTGTTPLTLWDNGVGEDGTSAGLLPAGTVLSRAETDGYKDGAIAANQQQNYRTVGLSLEIEVPHLTGTVNGDTAARRYLDAFGPYTEWLVRALANAMHIKFKYGGTQLGYEMGRPCFWPSMSSKVGALGAQFGRPLAGAFVPLRVPTFSGTALDENQLSVELHIDRTVQIESIAASPIPATAVGEFYQLPITCQLIGEPVPSGNVASISGVKNAAKQELNAMVKGAAAAANGDPAAFMRALAAMADAG